MYIECNNCGNHQHDSAPTKCQLCGYDPALDHELDELKEAIATHQRTPGANKCATKRAEQMVRIARRSELHRQGYGINRAFM